jgi:hypothetical protein
MAEISRECLDGILNVGVAIGSLNEAIHANNEEIVTLTGAAAEVFADFVSMTCPHPPNAASDEAPPRTFKRQLRLLRAKWQDQTLGENKRDWDSLANTFVRWLDGMTVNDPSKVAVR